MHNGLTTNFKSRMDKLGYRLLVKSDIKRRMPFLSVEMLLGASVIILIVLIGPLTAFFSYFPSAFILSAFLASIPVIILDAAARHNSDKVGKKMAELISILNRWYSVKEDIMHAFAMTASSGIGEPLAGCFSEMLIRVNSGMDPCEAIDMMAAKAGNTQFTEFLANIRQNIKCKGDMKRLLANMEFQAYKISEEFTRRLISTSRDRIIIYSAMAVVLAAGFFFISYDQRISAFYLDDIQGKVLLTVFMLVYALGTGFALSITRYKY